MSETGSRLSRWSRLKNEARQKGRVRFAVPEEGPAAPVSTPMSDSDVTESDLALQERASETAALADEGVVDPDSGEAQGESQAADLPDIESLDAESDYSPFMSDKVSDSVRNLALRKLWRSDSVFANLDGLIDYGEDFTDAATVVEGMKSVYTVGRGMVDYEAEEAAKLAAEQAEAEQALAAEDAPIDETDPGVSDGTEGDAEDTDDEREYAADDEPKVIDEENPASDSEDSLISEEIGTELPAEEEQVRV